MATTSQLVIYKAIEESHSSLLFKYFFSRKRRGGEVNRSCAAGACTSTSWSEGVKSSSTFEIAENETWE